MFQVEFMTWWLNKVIDLIYSMLIKKKKETPTLSGRVEGIPRGTWLPKHHKKKQIPPFFLVVGTRGVVMPWRHGSEGSKLPTGKRWQHDKAPLEAASYFWLTELIRIDQVALRIKEAPVGSDQSRTWITDWRRCLQEGFRTCKVAEKCCCCIYPTRRPECPAELEMVQYGTRNVNHWQV